MFAGSIPSPRTPLMPISLPGAPGAPAQFSTLPLIVPAASGGGGNNQQTAPASNSTTASGVASSTLLTAGNYALGSVDSASKAATSIGSNILGYIANVVANPGAHLIGAIVLALVAWWAYKKFLR